MIDLSCELQHGEGWRPLRFPSGSSWDRDWSTISLLGMTEAEVSLLLSDMDGDALQNMANLSLGIALDKTLADCGPVFVTNVASAMLGILSRYGDGYATGGATA